MKMLKKAVIVIAALSLLFLSTPAPKTAALAAEGKSSSLTLVIYAEADGSSLYSVFLAAAGTEKNSLSILSIPVRTRVMLINEDGSARYAPIMDAYSGQDPALSLKTAVKMLMDGIEINRVIAISPENLKSIVNGLKGIRINVSDLPSMVLAKAPGDSLTYPKNEDNDSLALWLKREIARQNAAADYDMDTAKILSATKPKQRSSPDMTTIMLSGSKVVEMLSYTIFTESDNTDILQILRMQNVFALIAQKASGSALKDEIDLSAFICYDGDDSFLGELAAFGAQRIRSSMTYPSGTDKTFGEEIYWIFDSIWLHDWVMHYVYLRD